MVDTKPIEALIQDLEDISSQNQTELDIPKLLNQLESCGKIMDLLDQKADSLLTKMDEILTDGQTVVDFDTSGGKIKYRNMRALLSKISKFMRLNLQKFEGFEVLGGKPVREAREDVKAAIDVVDYYAGIEGKFHPLGTVGLITSYNYPLLLLIWKLAPALLAGNKVIVKPAPQTPESTVYLQEFIESIAPGVMKVVQGGPEVAIDMIDNVDKVSFTGSTATGKLVAKQCAANFIPCTLELGGKNAAVICDNHTVEELRKIAKIVIDGAFSNSGQNCCAMSRLFVHQSVYNEFVEILTSLVSKIKIGDPKNEETEFGHLIDKAAIDKVERFMKVARDDGLNIKSFRDPVGLMYPPTLVLEVPDDHLIAQEEIFGPVLAIMKPFNDLDQVIQRVNNSKYGLAGGIFSKANEQLQTFVDKVEVGMIWQNTWNLCPSDVPFGGMKDSGWGKELGLQAVSSFSHQKSVVAGEI